MPHRDVVVRSGTTTTTTPGPQPCNPAMPWSYLVTCEAPLPCGSGQRQKHIQVSYGGQPWLYHSHEQLLWDAGLLWGQAGHLAPLLLFILCYKLSFQQDLLSLPGLGMSWSPVLIHIPNPQPLMGSGCGPNGVLPAQAFSSMSPS